MSDNTQPPFITMDDMAQFLRENLKLESKTTEEYNGGMDGGSMYTKYHVIELILDGEVIGSVSI